MTLNYTQIDTLMRGLEELQDSKVSFKLGMIIAKNLAALKKEEEFYIDQERKFALEYLKFDAEKQEFVQNAPGVFAIQEGKEEECRKARQDLNDFTAELELRKIPLALIENMEFTPKQLIALEMLIEEE